jgi:hypothetical protein
VDETAKKVSAPLAHALSGNSACPVPSAHDKANEAHYFLHQMMDHYHECQQFRYSLSAFLQAARSTTLVLQAELSHRNGSAEWYKAWQDRMGKNGDLKLLNSERVRVVHQEALIPASSMFFGAFELGRERTGFTGFPMNPMQDSVPALIEARARMEEGIGKYHFLDPYRSSNCVEYGLTRTWSLPTLKGTELTEFCTRAFAAIIEVLSAAHEWCGASFDTKVNCDHKSKEYRALRESTVFPEVEKAWDGPPTERLLPRTESLNLRLFPFDEAKVSYVVTPKKIARGWISDWPSPFWPRKYASMLIYSFAGRRIRLRNSVFFDRSQAIIERAKSPKW